MSAETTLTIVGNLTDNPELRFTNTGTAVASFTVTSTPRTFDKASGAWKDGEVLFLRCTAWRQTAENAGETLTKGSRVIVTGRLRQRSYETAAGDKRTVIELEVDELGASLRHATAQITKNTNTSTPAAGTAELQSVLNVRSRGEGGAATLLGSFPAGHSEHLIGDEHDDTGTGTTALGRADRAPTGRTWSGERKRWARPSTSRW